MRVMSRSKRKQKGDENSEPTAPFWMVTYGDMVTLLLTFFILLLSFSSLDEVKFKEAADSLNNQLNILPKKVSLLEYFMNRKLGQEESDYIKETVKRLEEIAKSLGMEDDIHVEMTETGLLIQLGDKVMFDPGKADIKSAGFPILNEVANSIKDKAREVLVSGHTDDVPIHTPQFPSNWELSAERALSVVRYLINLADVPPQILGATGYSEYRPLVPNDSSQNRQRNRRVEFLVTWK